MPLINILDLTEDIPKRIPPPAPAVSYSGSKHGMEIHVVRNGELIRLQTTKRETTQGVGKAKRPFIMLSTLSSDSSSADGRSWRPFTIW